MKRMARCSLSLLLMNVFVMSSVFAASDTRDERTTFWQEVKVHNEQMNTFKRAKQTEAKQLGEQIEQVETQLQQVKDEAAKKRLQTQRASLRAHQLDVLEELAKKEVEDAKQHVAFSQRWLKLSQTHLAELQARKAKPE